MAPVTATNVGMTPQTIDSPALNAFMKKLNSLHVENAPPRIDEIVATLQKYESWSFEEQADLYDWIPALNAMDASINFIIQTYPNLFLVPPLARKNSTLQETEEPHCATSMQDVNSVPAQVIDALCTLLRFTSSLLRNSTSKSVYNSVLELADLLGAASDKVASLALQALTCLAMPPALHKQQAPEMQHHSTALHNRQNCAQVHARLLACARGWGTRGNGLGLLHVVSADDSEYGQGSLSTQTAGQVSFEYFSSDTQKEECISLTSRDVLLQSDAEEMEIATGGKQKRRKTSPTSLAREKTKSTAELYFMCLEKAGGRSKIPKARLFLLLADIRLAKAFYSQSSRIAAVENRLAALVAILYAHSSQEIMSGYFTAQPELVVELIDLLRPTVSSASVSAAAAAAARSTSENGDLQPISALANSPQVPYNVRSLALEALTALVARRDGGSGGLTGVARQSSVLAEIGVGKGLYLGLLPTLIRYSLASLCSFLSMDSANSKEEEPTMEDATDAVAMDIGLAFVKATKPEPLPAGEQLRRALEFVDTVLTLTSSVVSAPSGTAALTECGLIPALLSMVAMDAKSTPSILKESSVLTPEERSNAKSLLRFITAQSIQIIEGAVVTYSNALSAFHDLNGVEVLTCRLVVEMEAIRQASNQDTPVDTSGDVEMADASNEKDETKLRSIDSSQRVLLFSSVNCLTVVFHQESGTATTAPMGGVQLRKPELTAAVKEIMDHVDSYGGVLVALISSLLSDVMNSDPQVVHHVHSSGLAESFLALFDVNNDDSSKPPVPPVAELIMGLPSVLSALSLTEDGATAVLKKNPFPGLLSIFYSPEYAMPKSRCMLNEMTAIVGTGLDEIMRHVQRHRPLVMNAIVEAMKNVVNIGSKLVEEEEAMDASGENDDALRARLEEQRTCLMQYATNFGQMLEQLLHNDEHCEPFVKAGGLEPILDLFPFLMPSGLRFLANASCLSCPSICTLAHSTTEDLLAMAFKCIALHYNSGNLVTKMVAALEAHMESLERIQGELFEAFADSSAQSKPATLSAEGVLQLLPCKPLQDVMDESFDFPTFKAICLSKYLRSVVTLQWISNLLAGVIRAGCQRSTESGSSWGRNEFKWKNQLFASPTFRRVMEKVAGFCQSANLEVCRLRTQDEFEKRDTSRLKKEEIGQSRVRYRLRIVCQEGALVRDGIEIDSCASVGSMEMGEVTDAFDRCVNSSGVMRYRTSRGWVSELTRGHGREPIAEVLNVWNAKDQGPPPLAETSEKHFNCGVMDLCGVGASVLARLQSSYCELFSSFSRELVQSFRALSPRSVTFHPSSVGGYVRGLLEVLASSIKQGICNEAVNNAMASPSTSSSESAAFVTSDAGIAMYLGSQISLLQSCLFDDNRERRNLNVPLLIRLLYTDEGDSSTITPSRPFFLDATGFIFRQSLSEFQDQRTNQEPSGASPHMIISRTVAASLPPAITLMHKLIPSSLLSSSTLTTVLSRLKDSDRFVLMADGSVEEAQDSTKQLLYRPDYFTKALQCAVAESLLEVWKDPRFVLAPAQIVHPVASLAKEALSSLEEKPTTNSSESNRSRAWDLFSRSTSAVGDRLAGRVPGDGNNGEDAEAAAQANFEPDEAIVSQLTDMGFSREHALDALESTRSNRLEVAMEYVLSISTLSSAELATRRAAREERARGGAGAAQDGSANNDEPEAAETGASEETGARDEEMTDTGSQNEGADGNGVGKDKDSGSPAEKKETEKSPDELMAKRVEECTRSWIESASDVAIRAISGASSTNAQSTGSPDLGSRVIARSDDGKGQGDAEAEALTVSLSSFLLDVCRPYANERKKIVSGILDRIAALFVKTEADGNFSWAIPQESSCSFASLCHAAVLCLRALPETRLLVLQKGIVGRLVSSIKTYAMTLFQSENGSTTQATTWPIWLTPGLLLLDVMAQPMAIPLVTGVNSTEDADQEVAAVLQEREKRAADIAQAADTIFSSVRQVNVDSEQVTKPKISETTTSAQANVAGKAGKETDDALDSNAKEDLPPFSKVPPYFALLPEDTATACMLLCLDLLGKGNAERINQSPPPPGVVQAVLSLLMRLVRSPKMASQCLEMGAAELILALPRECRFTGNSGVSTVILRRLLEDEATLQSSMASEMRYTISKLAGKKSRQGSPSESPTSVSTHTFVPAVTPLICRDPVSFLKAAATTVRVEPKEKKGKASDGNSTVVLLTPEESARCSKALNDVMSKKDVSAPVAGERRGSRASNGTKALRRRSGSRSSSKRSVASKKNKKERSDSTSKKNGPVTATPANHVMCQLIAKVVSLVGESGNPDDVMDTEPANSDTSAGSIYGESTSFLWLADTLEIMANLVLAVPACAAAIHRYRGSSKDGQPCLGVPHALRGCPTPPRTFVNFLLHSVLPQDRWTFKQEQLRDPRTDANKKGAKDRKKQAHMTTKVAQTSARLLVALVARAGEGRRRVIADLSFALSGGHLGHSLSSQHEFSATSQSPVDMEFHALQAWSDLCIGLAAPRSSGGLENSSTLSFEVVKLMLDFGMAHALMYALHRVHLQHPMTASTCASLLGPLEVFTRRNVTSSVQAIADKEAAAITKQKHAEGESKLPVAKKVSEAPVSVSAGPSQRNEAAFADDAMLEDGFDAETAARTSRRQQGIDFPDGDDEDMEDQAGEYDMMDDNGESNDSDEDEMEVDEDDDDDAESEDEEMSSDEDPGTVDVDEEGSDAESDDDEESSSDSQEDAIEEGFDDEEQEADGWEVNDDFLEGPVQDERANNERDPMMNAFELDNMDEGWTRVDANGFGGMLLAGARRPARAPNLSARASRGFIDAAEAMISSLLRNGDIDSNALSEIEGTLGIRIMPRDQRASDDDGEDGNPLEGMARRREALGETAQSPRSSVGGTAIATVPHIHQRSPPGFTAMGGGRWNEISAMEYIYGGPSIAAGSRNYDLSRSSPVQEDADSYHTPATVDMRLFPGGPAAATHSRTEPSVHPLLCGIDLPPVNSLVSDLLPHGTRAVRSAQPNRRPGDSSTGRSYSSSGFLLSAQGGNILRVNRPGDGSESAATRTATHGLHGWTEDGLPSEETVAGFSSAVEQAFIASMAPRPNEEPTAEESNEQPPEAETNAPPDHEEQAAEGGAPRAASEEQRRAESDGSATAGTQDTSSRGNQPSENEGRPSVASAEANGPPSGNVAPDESVEARAGENESLPNDGDGVASSLAAGLRLSPASEAMDTETQAEEAPQAEDGATEEEATSPNAADTNAPMQEDEPAQQEESNVDEPAAMQEDQGSVQQVEPAAAEAPAGQDQQNEVLTCPPGMDQEVFDSLPIEMQREVVEQNQVAADVAGQLDAASGLDPEALAALPEDMRREVIEQDQRERQARQQAPADPSNAEEMDNASFIASLAPDLREEILLTADDAFLNSLPPNIIAEAQVLRERASAQHRRANNDGGGPAAVVNRHAERASARNGGAGGSGSSQARKKQRPGKMKMDCDRQQILYLPSDEKRLSPLPGVSDMKILLRLLYLRTPVRPQRLLQRVFQNMCSQRSLRNSLCTAFVQLLNENGAGAVAALESISNEYSGKDDWRKKIDVEFQDDVEDFPPGILIGAPPEVVDADDITMFGRRQTNSAVDSIAASLPASAKGSNEQGLPPVVATTLVDTLLTLCKGSPRLCIDSLQNELVGSKLHETADRSLIFDKLLDLLEKPRYSKSAANLEQLLNLIEIMVSPLSLHPRVGEEEHGISQRDLDAAASAGKEYVDVPRIVVSQSRLQLLCSILRMESCRDASFAKVNSIARRLCRVEENRGYILAELGAVAQTLASDAIRDLRTLNIRMQDAAAQQRQENGKQSDDAESKPNGSKSAVAAGSASSSVTLSISSSELKLLRVLQTLTTLCLDASDENSSKKDGKIVVHDELVEIFQSMALDELWTHLDTCLHAVKVLEGVTTVEEMDEKTGDDDASNDGQGGKKLQNSVAGLLTRFLPIIEAFFVVNASFVSTRSTKVQKAKTDETKPADADASQQRGGPVDTEGATDASAEAPTDGTVQQKATAGADAQSHALIGGERLVEFVQSNRVLLNALIRNNPSLLEKALRSLVQVPRCRAMLDFDVKRHWFKTQVKRLRQQASRRHGSLRLGIRRKYVFEDAYHQLRLRNADEMRGRLHITFRNEEGVDAGGLSREFFGILGKEIFNPNYALFTSTEDGCTFQPNPNSSINPDHLSYFRFVGRIVGKAVADGFLLDAHFTRSLYKHMLGQKPTVGDMEAIDPDYYKNLQMILKHNLDDIGLELTFSAEDFSFGRRDIIDLLPNGRNIAVTEETKEKYVSLVCEHRMTTAISSQIKAYLDGFYEMVNRDLIAIFTPRELELLISGLPDIDVHDLRQNTEYQGYRPADKEILWFWNVMFSLSRSEKAAFLQFVTGSSKVPLAGFAELQGMRGVQKFSIHRAGGGSSGALMSAHTCFNSLDLPPYKSEEEMREKLLYAISEGGGAFMFA